MIQNLKSISSLTEVFYPYMQIHKLSFRVTFHVLFHLILQYYSYSLVAGLAGNLF